MNDLSMKYLDITMEQISNDKTALPCYCSGITRMWWNTRTPDFKDASDYWFNETLNMSKFENGLAGFKFISVGYGFIPNYSLLEGIAGIGLALTTYMRIILNPFGTNVCY